RRPERAGRLVASSPTYAASSPFLAEPRDKVVVIPYGIDVGRFRRADPGEVAGVRRRYGEPLILFVGQYRYYKGLEYLVAAMRQVDRRARLLLVGAGIEGAVGERVRALGLADRVRFAGETPNAELPK